MCALVQDPIYIRRNRVGLTAGGMETGKHCRQGVGGYGWRRSMARRFPREKEPEFPVHCTGTSDLSYVI